MTPEELIDDYLKRKAYAPAPPTGTSQEELTTGLLDNDIGNAIAEINKATELLKPPSQQVQIAPEQTEFNAKNKIDQGVIAQATRNGQPLQTPQTSFQVPNPLYYQDMNSIAGLKALNELAGEGTEGDVIRDWTHKQADLIRERAAATGKYDLSQFGANNATARDTVQQIESQRARDILEATMPDGKYYRTADQYYRDQYRKARLMGYSARQAKMFAGEDARRYQADRVGYLDAVYNSHGRDGYLTTPEGAQILAQLAQENPMLANFYGQVYSLPKDEYTRQSRLTEEAVKNNYQLGQLALQHGFTNENQFNQFRYNTLLQYVSHLLGLDKLDATTNANIRQYKAHKATDNAYKIADEIRAEANEEKAWQKKNERIENLGARCGFEGKDLSLFIAAAHGIKIPADKNGKMSDDSLKNLKELHTMLGSRETSLANQIKDLQATGSADPEQIAQLTAQLNEVRTQRMSIENNYGSSIGIEGVGESGVKPFSADDEVNNRTLAALWDYSGGNFDIYKENIATWLDDSGVTPYFKEQYLKKLKPYR